MKEPIIETCNVRMVIRERGKIKKVVEGHNVWTNSGREYSAQRKALNVLGQPYRPDHIDYIGLGTGAQVESVNVARLVAPVAFDAAGGNFLAAVDRSRTVFPLEPLRTAIRFVRVFAENEISFAGSTVEITEAGLFTNGDPTSGWSDPRNTGILSADSQEPVAYHSFEPIVKSPLVQLEIIWELRH
jgi:hypothetical protein